MTTLRSVVEETVPELFPALVKHVSHPYALAMALDDLLPGPPLPPPDAPPLADAVPTLTLTEGTRALFYSLSKSYPGLFGPSSQTANLELALSSMLLSSSAEARSTAASPSSNADEVDAALASLLSPTPAARPGSDGAGPDNADSPSRSADAGAARHMDPLVNTLVEHLAQLPLESYLVAQDAVGFLYLLFEAQVSKASGGLGADGEAHTELASNIADRVADAIPSISASLLAVLIRNYLRIFGRTLGLSSVPAIYTLIPSHGELAELRAALAAMSSAGEDLTLEAANDALETQRLRDQLASLSGTEAPAATTEATETSETSIRLMRTNKELRAKLREAKADASNELAQVQAELRDSVLRADNLAYDVERLQKALDERVAKDASLESSLTKLQSKVADHALESEQFALERAELESRVRSQAMELEALRARGSVATGRSLETASPMASPRVASTVADLADARDEITRLERVIRTSAATHAEALDALQHELNEARAENEHLYKEQAAHVREHASLLRELESARDSADDVQVERRRLNAVIVSLNSELKHTKAAAEQALELEKEAAANRVFKLERALTRAQALADSVIDASGGDGRGANGSAALADAMREWNEERNDLLDHVAQLQSKIARATDEKAELVAEFEETLRKTREVYASESNRKTADGEAALERARAAAVKAAREADAEKAELLDQIDELQARNATLAQRCDTSLGHNESVQLQRRKWMDEKARFLRDAEKWQVERSALIAAKTKVLMEHNEEIKVMRCMWDEEKASQQALLDAAHAKTKLYKGEVEELNAELEKIHAKLAEAQAELRAQRAEFESAVSVEAAKISAEKEAGLTRALADAQTMHQQAMNVIEGYKKQMRESQLIEEQIESELAEAASARATVAKLTEENARLKEEVVAKTQLIEVSSIHSHLAVMTECEELKAVNAKLVAHNKTLDKGLRNTNLAQQRLAAALASSNAKVETWKRKALNLRDKLDRMERLGGSRLGNERRSNAAASSSFMVAAAASMRNAGSTPQLRR
ncbi:uncharacterized protein AMSG_07313 [Thecamonas trahens ATCC 50062]|uniref:Uncharacterized protein n=1 Tax=Thecamonas trahens ATCC 50062 TaxID=461836 RepID=A0A0L0DG32_THETB|nr:hypothetical protein AMSG_07313 [Thecamonas trahens ATCC 50062]KNC51302.1 hypothetical protein AMSG_07313 [Thecamonas trahens ATCC 50062]|eukprot:XP_013756224.1 hypothetical protein AMSG_07313 [Thecamonas trahens ATCC 50062]